jgi:pilus assembly protein Flp/PilA
MINTSAPRLKNKKKRISMLSLVQRYGRNESGSTPLEYSMIALLVSVFIIGAVTALGDNVSVLFMKIDSSVSSSSN